ncbi:unnamed protein product [Amoebophrya sp. A25]|nr:unnamed protein product [Amoebophrya sp. A25]|eukprot:GSA25T00020249001.1
MPNVASRAFSRLAMRWHCGSLVRRFFFGDSSSDTNARVPVLVAAPPPGGQEVRQQADPLVRQQADPLVDVLRQFPGQAVWFIKVAMVFGSVAGLFVAIPCALFLLVHWDRCRRCNRPLHAWLLVHTILLLLQTPVRLVFWWSVVREERRGQPQVENVVQRLTSAPAWRLSKVISVCVYIWFVLGLVWILNSEHCADCPGLYRLVIAVILLAIIRLLVTLVCFYHCFPIRPRLLQLMEPRVWGPRGATREQLARLGSWTYSRKRKTERTNLVLLGSDVAVTHGGHVGTTTTTYGAIPHEEDRNKSSTTSSGVVAEEKKIELASLEKDNDESDSQSEDHPSTPVSSASDASADGLHQRRVAQQGSSKSSTEDHHERREAKAGSSFSHEGIHLQDVTSTGPGSSSSPDRIHLQEDVTSTPSAVSSSPLTAEDDPLSDTDEPNCAVCLAEFVPGELCRTLPCGHEFHQTCIDTWLLKNRKCPLCLQDITVEKREVLKRE